MPKKLNIEKDVETHFGGNLQTELLDFINFLKDESFKLPKQPTANNISYWVGFMGNCVGRFTFHGTSKARDSGWHNFIPHVSFGTWWGYTPEVLNYMDDSDFKKEFIETTIAKTIESKCRKCNDKSECSRTRGKTVNIAGELHHNNCRDSFRLYFMSSPDTMQVMSTSKGDDWWTPESMGENLVSLDAIKQMLLARKAYLVQKNKDSNA